ncbi:MAG: LPP20 family lipoprotein, partial [Bacteroidales bacterium]|nr:LPP20 family lipoprotein [Bacteroidales bacterium]
MRRYIVILALFLASCAAKKQAAEFEAQPDWVKQKPIISGYYIGVSSVKKVGTSAQYIAKSRQEALTDLAESVSSNVSSTSVLHSIETEYGFSESFDQRINVSTDDYLEGFDPVDFYENESSYWVYYKIAKSTYHEMKEKKKKEAIATALAKYQSGLDEQKVNKPKEALAFYLQGLQAIKRYLNEETSSRLEGDNIDIGNELYSATSEILNSLAIESATNEITVKRGESFSNNLEFILTYNNKPVQSIPVKFSYTGGYLKKDRQNSDVNGLVQLEPEVLYSRNGREQITATINLKDLAQKAVDDLFIRGLILKRNLKPAIVQVIIEAPSLALIITDNSCSGDECDRIENLFNQNAKQYGYELKDAKSADFVFELSYSFK